MIIKHAGDRETLYEVMDLLPNNEVGLSKALAFVLSKDKNLFASFLKLIGINLIVSKGVFANAKIEIEKRGHMSGRLDIDIETEKHHIVVECKIRTGAVSKEQINKYLPEFEKGKENLLVLLTQDMSSGHLSRQTTYITWGDVISTFSSHINTSRYVREFIGFFERSYKMKSIKEILVQDIKGVERERFLKYNIYRRDTTAGSPLYFAPHFTEDPKGVSYIAEVLGIINIDKDKTGVKGLINDRLRYFAKTKYDNDSDKVNSLVALWEKGIKLTDIPRGHTFYFLDYHTALPFPLQKDGGNKKGRGKNWIAAMINKNRCVSFLDLINQINKQWIVLQNNENEIKTF